MRVLPHLDVIAPYDALMDTTALVAPPYVVEPFRLLPFRAMMTTPSAIGDPASARAFAPPYRDVPDRLKHWRSVGRITSDADPALYLHEYTAGGVTVRGLVGTLDLTHNSTNCPDASQAIFPHEGIHREQVDELADRMLEMEINPAPILLVHRGPKKIRELLGEVQSRPPTFSFSDRAGQMHRVWPLRDRHFLTVLDEELAETRAFIADGHHRYAGYLRLQQSHPQTAWDRGLAMLIDQSDTPLWLGSIHRFIVGRNISDVIRVCANQPHLECHRTNQIEALESLGRNTMVLSDNKEWATLRVIDREKIVITTFQEDLLPLLGIEENSITFHHSAESACRQVRHRYGLCVLVPLIEYETVATAANAGILLPKKTTSFQPKPSQGVFIRNLRED
jgi:uncharacterized protein (DUF1015 family)